MLGFRCVREEKIRIAGAGEQVLHGQAAPVYLGDPVIDAPLALQNEVVGGIYDEFLEADNLGVVLGPGSTGIDYGVAARAAIYVPAHAVRPGLHGYSVVDVFTVYAPVYSAAVV